MFACYILHSASKDKFYIGFVQDSIESRLQKHNAGFYDNTYTSFATDWVLYLLIECENSHQAICLEKHIKRMKSKEYIRNLKKYPEMISKLLENYRT